MSGNSGNGAGGNGTLHTDSKTIWVGDIEAWMDDNYVSNVFSKIGPVVGVKLIRDKQTGAPMGYGFVEFASHEIAARVLQISNGTLNSGGAGNPTTGPPTNRTDSRKPNDTRTNDRDRSASSRKHPSNNEGYQIYVGELDIGINKQQLLEPFKKKYHSAFDSKIITDPATKLSKGYGFVQFSNYEESQKAIAEMQGFMIRGKPIKVSPGFSRNSMNPGSATGKSGSSTNQSRFSTQKGGINGPGGVFALGAGTMLGGLGVQIKSPENPTQTSIMGLAAGSQQFGILPGQMQPTHQVGLQNAGLGTTQGLYAQTLAEQQKLLYYQALLSGGNLANNPQAAQLLSLAAQGQQLQMNPSGMYGAQGLSLLAASQMQTASLPYPIMLQPGAGIYGPPQAGNPWGTPMGFGTSLLASGAMKEEPKHSRQPAQNNNDELTIEGQCNHRLAVLHFMQNHDIRSN